MFLISKVIQSYNVGTLKIFRKVITKKPLLQQSCDSKYYLGIL